MTDVLSLLKRLSFEFRLHAVKRSSQILTIYTNFGVGEVGRL